MPERSEKALPPAEVVFIAGECRMGEDFCRQVRRFPEAILGGLQGKVTQYAGKKTAQTVRNGYENNF